jgi:hypothetical protein
MRLQHIKPATALSSIRAQRELIPKGIKSVVPSNRTNLLTITGTNEAVKSLRELIALLDVRPRTAILEMSVKRYEHLPDGTSVVETLLSERIRCVNATQFHTTSSDGKLDFNADFTPYVNGDGSVMLSGDTNFTDEEVGELRIPLLNRIVPGHATRLAGKTASGVPEIRQDVSAGDVLTASVPCVVVYVEVNVLR